MAPRHRIAACAAIAATLVAVPARADHVLDAMERDGRFDIFAAAARVSGIREALAGHEGGLTVFAPTDDAFGRMPDDRLEDMRDADRQTLEDFVKRHVVSGGSYPADALPEQMTALDGAGIEATVDGRGVALSVQDGPQARIVETGVEAGDTRIHGIDGVLTAEMQGASRARTDETGGAAREDFVAAIAAVDDDGSAPPLERSEPARQPSAPEIEDVPAAPETNDQTVRLNPEQVTVVRSQEAPSGADDTDGGGTVVTLPPEDRSEAAEQSERAEPEPAPQETGRSRSAAAPKQGSMPQDRSDVAADDEPVLDLSRAAVSVTDLLGREVLDGSGERVGEIGDIFLSLETGRAERIVVEVDSGFLDLADRRANLEPDQIAIDPLNDSIVVDRAALERDSGGSGE